MPGSARMYPETDIMAINPKIEGNKVPELITEKAMEYEGEGVSKDLASQLAKSERLQWFEDFRGKYGNVSLSFIATTLLTTEKEIRARYKAEKKFGYDYYDEIFKQLNKGTISKEAVLEILIAVAKGENLEVAIRKYKKLSDDELEKELRKIVASNKGLPINALIGRAMSQLRGKADGRKIVEILKKLAK
jgi:glutamyl-tRNA(Gln) amidotransferase subunit E